MKKRIIYLSVLMAAAFSCAEENGGVNLSKEQKNGNVQFSDVESSALLRNGIDIELESNISKVMDVDQELDEVFEGYRIGDIFVDKEELADMVEEYKASKNPSSSTPSTELYVRTNDNRIELPRTGRRTIVIAAMVNTNRALDQQQIEALEAAVDDINALGLEAVRLRFERRTARQHNTSNNKNSTVFFIRDARNTRNFRDGEFALSSFSKNGNPGSRVFLAPQVTGLNTPGVILKGIMLHEIGHAFGLVHSDFDTRSSCGLNSTDGARRRGIEHVPGTSTDTNNTSSVMAACATDIGMFELTNQDRVGFRRIFQRSSF